MRILKSIEARIQNFQHANFEKTRYGKKLAKLKDIHKGEKCFIIGNGPSLRPEDLTLIHKARIPSFAANRIYNTFDKTDWRPAYYFSEDQHVLAEIRENIEKYIEAPRFIPIHLKWYEKLTVKDAAYFKQLFGSNYDPDFLTDDITKGVPCRGTVAVTCAQFAIYMGFTEIYLIGIDHNFSRMTDKDGNLIVDNTVKDHYGDVKNADEKTKGIFNVDNATTSFMHLKDFADARGVKIFNATRGGKLEVYPRVDLDEFFK